MSGDGLKEGTISFAVAALAAVNAAFALALERKQKLAILNRQMSTAAGRAHLMTSPSCATASVCGLVSSRVFYSASVDHGWEVLLAMSLDVLYLFCFSVLESLDVC